MSSSTIIEGLQNLDGITWDVARLNHACGALAKLGHLAAQALCLTETAFHAAAVLPASAFAEGSGISCGEELPYCDPGPVFSTATSQIF